MRETGVSARSDDVARTPEDEPVVELVGVSAGYDGHNAVKTVSLTVERGEVVALLGANGSGKTTLIKTAMGLLDARAGEIRLFGSRISGFHQWRRIGYVPQRLGASSGVPATVREVVAAGLLARSGRFGTLTALVTQLSPAGRAQRRAAIDTALEAVELASLAQRPVATLSGGQQQRVLIARALAAKPDLLVLDEPTVGVDAASQRALAQAIATLVKRDITVLLVTHEMGVLTPLITRTVVMRHGEISYDGPVQKDLHGHHHDPHHPQEVQSALWGEQL